MENEGILILSGQNGEAAGGVGAGGGGGRPGTPAKKRTRADRDNPALDKYSQEQYAYYSSLKAPQRKKICLAEKRLARHSAGSAVPLRFRLLQSGMDDACKTLVMSRAEGVINGQGGPSERAKMLKWVEALLRVPFGVYRATPVTARSPASEIAAFVKATREKLDKNIYGHAEAKQQVIQTLAKWISNPGSKGNVIGIEGPMGCGKTTLAKTCIAEALGLPLAVVPLGGLTDVHILQGHGFTYEGSTHGVLAGALMKAGCMNPVVLLDELDKVGDSTRGQEVSNLLIHLTDVTQNEAFTDHYFSDIPLDFSKALLVFTYNDASAINPILRDRMTCIRTDGYTQADKCVIARKHLLPRIQQQYGFPPGTFTLGPDAVASMVSRIDDEAGVRNLYRAIDRVVSNVNLRCYLDDTDRNANVVIDDELIRQYVPPGRKSRDVIPHMYM
jgi:ATP-dependent Lon protease